ncbi:MAG: glycoside hydrolase family 20 zincin-like fold domain-containing protein [Phycisphaerae bacterium]|jgi:hypothetical protein
MFRKLNVFALIIAVLTLVTVSLAVDCPIVPTPKEYKALGDSFQLAADTAIVIGDNATEVDEYAAERLQFYVNKRFGIKLEIKKQSAAEEAKSVILLGTRQSCAKVDQFCKESKIALDANTPGFDGYIIETIKSDGGFTVLIGGSNARGVTYGMVSFFDLLAKDGDKIMFPAVSVKDWPSIKWRGRNCAKVVGEEAYDSYVRARINYVDTLYPMVGLPKTGFTINEERVTNVLNQAHRRGIYVYATVNCAVKPELFDNVYDSYVRLLDMGVDGIWLSFDDAGEGMNADVLIKRVLELAKKRNLPDNALVMTPPAGSYHNIETTWNKYMAPQKGFDSITWFFTRPPCDCDVQTAKKIGLNAKRPGWWHNWARPASGLLNAAYGVSMYDKSPYFEPMPLEIGWHMPTYDELADAAKYADTIVACTDGREEYIMPVLGYWAWDPAKHNWDAVRTDIYSFVYGAAQVNDAKKFDDSLSKLKDLFKRMHYKSQTPDLWPPRLIDPATKPQAIAYVNAMDAALKKLKANAPAASMIDANRLETVYFDAMQDTVDYGKKIANFEYPEYWLKDFDESMIALIKTDSQAAAKRIEEVKPKVEAELAEISNGLKNVKGVTEYVDNWNQKLSGIDYWQKQIKSRKERKVKEQEARQEMAKIWESTPKSDYTKLLAAEDNRPKGKVLLEITPAEFEKQGSYSWTGTGWAMGLVRAGQKEAFAIQFDGTCNATETASLNGKLIVPEHKGKLKVVVFATHLYEDKNNPPAKGNRVSVVQFDRKWVWVQDSTNDMTGCEWITFDLAWSDAGTVKAGDVVPINFIVYNHETTSNLKTTVLFGPVLVIEETK